MKKLILDHSSVDQGLHYFPFTQLCWNNLPGRVAQSVGHLTGPGFDTRSGNILSFLLPLFQEGQLSVTGESMCTEYWLTA